MPYAPEPWQSQAACASYDPELWFADKGDRFTLRRAREICAACPVSEECLDTALAQREEFGMWGGKLYYERKLHARYAKKERIKIPHGTLEGYRRHKANHELPCLECEQAEERRRQRMVCGTRNGYMSHNRMGEEACDACKEAYAEDARQRRAAKARSRSLSLSRKQI